MDDLLILLIRAIVRWTQGDKNNKTGVIPFRPVGAAPPPPIPPSEKQPGRATRAAMVPLQRRRQLPRANVRVQSQSATAGGSVTPQLHRVVISKRPAPAVPPPVPASAAAILNAAQPSIAPGLSAMTKSARRPSRITATQLRQQFIMTEILRPPLGLRSLGNERE